MNFKPSDLFIGLMEFFSVFLPGFIAACLFSKELRPAFFKNIEQGAHGTFGGTDVAFYFVTAYIAGHFIYATGACLIGQVLRHYDKEVITFSPSDRIIMNKAEEIMRNKSKSVMIQRNISDESLIDTKGKLKFIMWANTIIQIKHPDSLIGVRQNEADAKFFRSFIIVSFLGLFVTFYHHDKDLLWLLWTIISLFSLCLYFFRRLKVKYELANIIIAMDNWGEFDLNLKGTK